MLFRDQVLFVFLQRTPFLFCAGPVKRPTRGRGAEKEKAEDLIFNMEAHSSKELRHFKFLSVSFMAQLLAAGSFVGMVI